MSAAASQSAQIPPANSIESFTGRKRVRRNFGKIDEVAQMPNLIEVQRQSYELFLQADITAEDRTMQGLEEVFATVFPIIGPIKPPCMQDNEELVGKLTVQFTVVAGNSELITVICEFTGI